MSWLRIDDGFTEHRKLLKLKRQDRWTWMEVMTYCARQNDGGLVPEGIGDILRYVTPAFINACVQAGLLDVDGDNYRVHDWSEYNPRDPTNAARQQRYRQRSRNGSVTQNVTDKNVTNVTPPRARVPSPTRPLSKTLEVSNPSFLPSPPTDGTEGRNINLESILGDVA